MAKELRVFEVSDEGHREPVEFQIARNPLNKSSSSSMRRID